jgi:flagellin
VPAQAGVLGQNLSTVQTYQSFDKNLINDLNAGSNDLTAADTNEESAALLTLQTQQQLGISALSLASQAQQAVLKLFP